MIRHKQNLSTEEIEKFSRFSRDWWDENGIMKSLHDINPVRLTYIMKHARLSGRRVLDVGCGGGILTEKIALQGAQTTGVDASSEMIAIARNHAEKSNLDIVYIHTDVEHISHFIEPGFDVILCMELLEHVPDYLSIIHTCRELLNPDGLIIFATINRNLLSYLLAIVCAERILGLLPRGTHQYASLIRPDELEDACAAAGLTHIDSTGFSYQPLSGNYYFCKNTLVNYMASFRPA